MSPANTDTLTPKITSESYYFPNGIPGFENCQNFKLVKEEGLPLAQLICQEDESIGFILIHPEVIFPDYTVIVDDESQQIVGIQQGDEAVPMEIWALLTNHTDVRKITVNLKAPIVLNIAGKRGLQLILNDDRYLSRQSLPLDEGKPEGDEA